MKRHKQILRRLACATLALSLLLALTACTDSDVSKQTDKEDSTNKATNTDTDEVSDGLPEELSCMRSEVVKFSLALDELPEDAVRKYVYVGEEEIEDAGKMHVFEVYLDEPEKVTLVSRYALSADHSGCYAYEVAVDRWFPMEHTETDTPWIDRRSIVPNYDDAANGINFIKAPDDLVEIQGNSTQILRPEQFSVFVLTADKSYAFSTEAAQEEQERLFTDSNDNPQFVLGNFAWNGSREEISMLGGTFYSRPFTGYLFGTLVEGVFYYGNAGERGRWVTTMMFDGTGSEAVDAKDELMDSLWMYNPTAG